MTRSFLISINHSLCPKQQQINFEDIRFQSFASHLHNYTFTHAKLATFGDSNILTSYNWHAIYKDLIYSVQPSNPLLSLVKDKQRTRLIYYTITATLGYSMLNICWIIFFGYFFKNLGPAELPRLPLVL